MLQVFRRMLLVSSISSTHSAVQKKQWFALLPSLRPKVSCIRFSSDPVRPSQHPIYQAARKQWAVTIEDKSAARSLVRKRFLALRHFVGYSIDMITIWNSQFCGGEMHIFNEFADRGDFLQTKHFTSFRGFNVQSQGAVPQAHLRSNNIGLKIVVLLRQNYNLRRRRAAGYRIKRKPFPV